MAPPRKDERSSARTEPDELHTVAVEAWHDLLLEVLLVLNDARNPKRDTRLFGGVDRRDHSLVRVDASEERQVGTRLPG